MGLHSAANGASSSLDPVNLYLLQWRVMYVQSMYASLANS